MSIILGLDVSTSCTGVCILDEDAKQSEDDPTTWSAQIKWLDGICFKGCKTFWDKADCIEEYFLSLETAHHIGRVVLEEPLMGFRQGMSSAQTITQLMRFNGIVSNLARKRFNAVPEYIGSAHARKLCGMKLQRTAVAGMSQKEQVFKQMSEGELSGYPWPLKKNGDIVDWSRDATDSYVIARAASLEGFGVERPKKPKKSKVKVG